MDSQNVLYLRHLNDQRKRNKGLSQYTWGEKIANDTHEQLNGSLRNNKKLTGRLKDINDSLYELAKPLNKEMRLFRGEVELTDIEVGKLHSLDQWTSTSTSPSMARSSADNGRIYDIVTEKNTKGIITNAAQMEVILRPDTKYRVLEIQKVPKDKINRYGFAERVIIEVVE